MAFLTDKFDFGQGVTLNADVPGERAELLHACFFKVGLCKGSVQGTSFRADSPIDHQYAGEITTLGNRTSVTNIGLSDRFNSARTGVAVNVMLNMTLMSEKYIRFMGKTPSTRRRIDFLQHYTRAAAHAVTAYSNAVIIVIITGFSFERFNQVFRLALHQGQGRGE